MLKDVLQGKPFRHPLHAFLVHFPIGLFALSLILDFAGLLFPQNGWVRGAYYSLALGIITALVASVPGFVDYTDIRRDHPARRIATAHMGLNLFAVALYGVNLGLRSGALDDVRIGMAPLILSLIALGVLSFSGYLGGHMVYSDGVGVGRHRRRAELPEATLGLSALAAPDAEQGEGTRFVPVPKAARMKDQETLRLDVDGLVLVLAKIEGKFFAFQEFCTHRFGPLSEGSFQGEEVRCPWHGSCFNVRNGRVTVGPAKEDLKIFATEIRDGQVGILIPRERPKQE